MKFTISEFKLYIIKQIGEMQIFPKDIVHLVYDYYEPTCLIKDENLLLDASLIASNELFPPRRHPPTGWERPKQPSYWLF